MQTYRHATAGRYLLLSLLIATILMLVGPARGAMAMPPPGGEPCCEGEDLPAPPPPPPPAAAPTDFGVSTNTSSSITLSWTDNSTDETQFTIDKAVNGYWRPVTHLSPNPGTGRMSTTIAGLPSNTSYKLRIFASPGSMSNGPMLDAATRPETPRDVTASAGSTTIGMRFAPPPSADRLVVDLKRVGTGDGLSSRTAAIDARSTSYVFKWLTPSTRYCVKVIAEGPGGQSPSEPLCRTTNALPPPPDPVYVNVPSVIGLTYSEAWAKLKAAKLDLGTVTPPAGEIWWADLPVIEQTPPSGSRVLEGTDVALRIGARKVTGVKAVRLINSHQQGRTVRIHVYDGWRWSAGEDLPYNQSKTVSLASGAWSTIVAVDRGLIGCDDGRPENLSCQRWKTNPILGDSTGSTVDERVY